MDEMKRTMEEMETSLESIEKQLICHVCKGKPRSGEPYWYRCMNLHLICQSCRGQGKKCLCQAKVLYTSCSVIEAFLKSKKRFKCKNESRGCEECLNNQNMKAHESECIYRLVNCPRISCKTKLPKMTKIPAMFRYEKLLQHMEQNNDFSSKEPLHYEGTLFENYSKYRIWILAFSTNFCPIKSDLSVW